MGSSEYWAGRVYDLYVYFFMTGALEGSTETNFGEVGNQACDRWFTRHSTYPLHHSSNDIVCGCVPWL